jgi:FMN phosphatase YigB (HAD superfamily)
MYALRSIAQAASPPGRRAGPPHAGRRAEPAPAPLASPPVAALLFDPENVFYDATLWKRWLSQLLARVGVHAPFPEFFARWEEEFRSDVDLGRRDYWDALREFLAQEGLPPAMIAEIFAAAICRRRRIESEIRCLTGIAETLLRLHATGISLAVVSNAPLGSEQVLRDFDRMGLRGLFAASVTSLEAGEPMPRPGCYRLALDRLGLSAEEAAFVGSQPRSLEGASRVGLRTIAFNCLPEPPAGSTSLERFPELCRLVPAPVSARRAG